MQDEEPLSTDQPDTDVDELTRLRAENERLRAQLADTGSTSPSAVADRAHRTARRRGITSVALIVVGSLLLPLAVFTVWTRNQVLDTDRYVRTVAPLGEDPVVISAVSNRISSRIAEELDIESLARDALPDNATFLAAPIASGANNLIHSATTRLLESEQFRTLWVDANRTAHDGVVAVLTGRSGDIVDTRDGKVVISLGAVVTAVLAQLDEQFGTNISSRVPADRINIDFEIIDSRQLAQAQVYTRLLDRLSWLTVVLSLAFLVGGVLVGPDRRRGVFRVGVGVAVSMLVSLVAVSLFRGMYLSNLPDAVQRADAAAVLFDTLTRFVLQAIRVLFAVGVVVGVAAWVCGPSRAATRARHWWDVLLGRGSAHLGGAVDLGPVPRFVAAHAGWLRAFIAAGAVVTLLLWTLPTGRVVVLIALLTLIPIAIVQLLAGIGSRGASESPDVALPDGSEGPSQEEHAGSVAG